MVFGDVEGFLDVFFGVVDIYFWNGDIGGGLQINDYYGGDYVLVLIDGLQFYIGIEDVLIFKLGIFVLIEYQGIGIYMLIVINISVVLELVIIVMLLGGLGVVGFMVCCCQVK